MNHSKYKIALFKNDQYVGDIHYMNTGNLKWFKSKETAQRFIDRYCSNPKPNNKFKVVDYNYRGKEKENVRNRKN